MSLYAIGDIHGCFNALTTIFNQHTFDKNDAIVFLGDYVDRGSDTKGSIDWLIKHSNNYNFIFLQGNHEIMMLAARDEQEYLNEWLGFGGKETLASYGIKPNDPNWANKISDEHWAFIENCRSYYETDTFIFVHAGLEPNIPLENQSRHNLFWKKFEVPEPYSNSKRVICGHTSRKNGKIADFGHTTCIDTYAYGGMWLTCLNVETNSYLQANENEESKKGNLVTPN